MSDLAKFGAAQLKRERNEILRRNNYRWHKTSDCLEEGSDPRWVLLDSQNDEVSEKEALEKIYGMASIFPFRRGGYTKKAVGFDPVSMLDFRYKEAIEEVAQ